jgi:hypothetical protein
MTMHDMLSHPIPPLVATSCASIESSISSTRAAKLSFVFFFFNFSITRLTASYEDKQSHMPSQAQIIKSVSLVIFSIVISGNAVMI